MARRGVARILRATAGWSPMMRVTRLTALLGPWALLLSLGAVADSPAAVAPEPETLSVPAPAPGQIPPELAPAIDAIRRGDAAAALQSAMEFVKRNPTSALGQEVLGTAALLAWDLKGAEIALAESLRLEPGRASAMVRLGQVALRAADPARAEEWFRKALAVRSE